MLSPIDEIKNKLDVVEVVSGYIKLTKAGRNFKARCPFHPEKTPSFMVSPELQIWHCFGCGKGGDIFGFVKEIENIDFSEALRVLAQRAGVVLKKQNPKLKSEKQRHYEICELSAKFFEKQLSDSRAAARIRKYLLERGINKESIRSWRLGYAPDDWRALSNFLKSRGYRDEEIIKSGVVVEKMTTDHRLPTTAKNSAVVRSQSAASSYYDRFSNRIIFPIFDLNGQIVGFAGRVAPGQKEESAKYINTPQTLIYDKSGVLYGLDKAKADIKTKNYCILVEGNTDVIMSHQTGFKNSVASSGTALTENHLKIIKRYTENLILAFDADLAGNLATKRAIDLAVASGLNVKIIQQEEEKEEKSDPAAIIKKNPRQWAKIISNAVGIIEFYFQNAFAQFDASKVSGKKEIARTLLPLIKKIPDKIEQNHWLQELAQKLKVKEKVLEEAIRGIVLKKEMAPREGSKQIVSGGIKSRLANLEEELVGLALISENLGKIIKEISRAKHRFTSPRIQDVFENLKQYLQKVPKSFDLKKWQRTLSNDLTNQVEQILFRLEVQNISADNLEKYLSSCFKLWQKENIRQRLNNLQGEIKEHEKMGEKGKLNLCLREFRQLAGELVE